ncbi:MAG TPA: hypothetical protein VG708_13945 [Mycobacteriales bacterium]|nr:hypothetical protein [Mycobacteriales bacterium]
MSARPAARVYGAATPSLDRIVTVALAIIDDHGVEGLSMRRLAVALDSYPANLYRRFTHLDELLGLVAVRIIDEAGGTPSPDLAPEASLLDFALRIRAGWLRHPRATPLLFAEGSDPLAAVMEAVLTCFESMAVDPVAAVQAAYEFVIVLFGAIFAGASTAIKHAQADARLPDAAKFPATARANAVLAELSGAPPHDQAAATLPQFERAIRNVLGRAAHPSASSPRRR